MFFIITYIVLFIVCLYVYIDIGKTLYEEYYKEEQETWYIYIFYIIKFLFSPKSHFKAEYLRDGYRLFIIQQIMLVSFIVLLIALMREGGYKIPF